MARARLGNRSKRARRARPVKAYRAFDPRRVGSLPFGQPNEVVGGSTFDPDRKVAFAITSRRVDPFYALSFADPANQPGPFWIDVSRSPPAFKGGKIRKFKLDNKLVLLSNGGYPQTTPCASA